MIVPEQASVLGGIFTCPRCQVVTTIAPRAVAASGTSPLVMTKPTTPWDRFVQSLVICAVIGIGSIVFVHLTPICATILGALSTGITVLYIARPGTRPRIDAFFRVTRKKQWHKQFIAILAGIWSFFALFLYGSWITSGGPERAEASRIATAAAKREAAEQSAEEEKERKRKLADSKLDEAETQLGGGRLDQALESVEQARSLDSESSRVAIVREKIEKSATERALATLPEKRNAILEKSKAGAWPEAGRLCVEARKVSTKDTQIEAACGEVDAELRKLDTAKWILEANRTASEECDTPATLGNAWKSLRQIRPDESAYEEAKKSAAKLEKCRKSTERTLSAGIRSIMISQRIEWAKRYESSLLDSGVDASVTLHGKQKDHVKIRWVLVGRAMVHQVTKDGEFLANLEKIGFKKVTFSDGYFESWYFDLSPEDEANGGKLALRDVGLEQPIKM